MGTARESGAGGGGGGQIAAGLGRTNDSGPLVARQACTSRGTVPGKNGADEPVPPLGPEARAQHRPAD